MTGSVRLYLSSFRVGDEADRLRTMVGDGTLALIPNAMDHVDEPARSESNARAAADLEEAGVRSEELDLRSFFGRPSALADALSGYEGAWVRGGNAFVLRRAMHLSGFDSLLPDLIRSGWFYGGYSAGICVLAPDLRGIARVDDPEADPHGLGAVIWAGVGALLYLILPHYRSDHWESEAIEGEVEYCRTNGIPHRTLRDGEVIIIEDPSELTF